MVTLIAREWKPFFLSGKLQSFSFFFRWKVEERAFVSSLKFMSNGERRRAKSFVLVVQVILGQLQIKKLFSLRRMGEVARGKLTPARGRNYSIAIDKTKQLLRRVKTYEVEVVASEKSKKVKSSLHFFFGGTFRIFRFFFSRRKYFFHYD